jgi:hypothetical protein
VVANLNLPVVDEGAIDVDVAIIPHRDVAAIAEIERRLDPGPGLLAKDPLHQKEAAEEP